MVVIELPYPPSLNRLYRINAGGKGVRKSEAGKRYQQAVKLASLRSQGVEGKVLVTIDVFPPDRRKRDLDNLLKILLDALTKAALIEDDSKIDRLLVQRREVIRGGRVTVVIKSMECSE